MRLCDLGGSGSENVGGTPVEAGGWGNSLCRWQDLDASQGGELVGVGSFADGDLLLLQDLSQPLKKLTAAVKASIGSSDGKGNGAKTWAASSSPRRRATAGSDGEGCDMTSIGSWYAGGSTADEGFAGGGAGSGSSSPLMLNAKSWAGGAISSIAGSSSASSPIATSFKPKERALRIRTRRDRLQEGKMSAAATAAATAVAVATATAAAAAATIAASAAACPSVVTGSMTGADSGGAEVRSPGSSSDVTVVGKMDTEAVLSSAEDTVDAAGAVNVTDGVVGRTTADRLEDVCYENLWGLTEEGLYGGSLEGSDQHGGNRVEHMHSESEVLERGGLDQFEDLA